MVHIDSIYDDGGVFHLIEFYDTFWRHLSKSLPFFINSMTLWEYFAQFSQHCAFYRREALFCSHVFPVIELRTMYNTYLKKEYLYFLQGGLVMKTVSHNARITLKFCMYLAHYMYFAITKFHQDCLIFTVKGLMWKTGVNDCCFIWTLTVNVRKMALRDRRGLQFFMYEAHDMVKEKCSTWRSLPDVLPPPVIITSCYSVSMILRRISA